MTATRTYLKDYCPPDFEVTSVFLNIDLWDTHADITQTMLVTQKNPGFLTLNGEALELLSIHINGTALTSSDYQLSPTELRLVLQNTPSTVVIKTRIFPQNNTLLSGLYRSNQLFCTQCEAEGFRRITYFPDRPDVLTRFTTRITADAHQYPILLSNGHCIERETLSEGRHAVVWHDPFKKPCYLFALVAGNLACVKDVFQTISGRTIDLHFYVEPGHENECDHAMHALKQAMRWDEERYGREYDLNLYMIVAVSDFNMGAMENKGLNIFNAKYVLARPETATDQDYADIESVIAHEYFHNWTGNRVTCRDWFQLSLKEGLTVFRDQEFSRDMNTRDVCRIQDVALLRQTQFPEDASAMAHPVQPTSYQEINNFYTATIYNKGAEVIRMQETLLSHEGFRRGMDLYFKRHDGQAVTIDAFIKAMEDANEYDLSAFRRWYTQAGTPIVHVHTTTNPEGEMTISLKQSSALAHQKESFEPWVIPIRYRIFDQNGTTIAEDLWVLSEKHHTYHIHCNTPAPRLSLLQDFSAPIILDYPRSLDERLHILHDDQDGFVRWDTLQSCAIETLQTWYHQPPSTWFIDPKLLDTYRDLLHDETLDMALRAILMTPPSFEAVAQTLTAIDVQTLEQARQHYIDIIAQYLQHDAWQWYERLDAEETHDMTSLSFQRRAFKNICLRFLVRSKHPNALSCTQHQFKHARTMTDQLASFELLIHHAQEPLRREARDHFYMQWSCDELVLDKWFAIQATSPRSDILSVLNTLLDHPKFVITNPNKVRALVGAFCQGNPLYFHDAQGQGYQFLASMLLKLDPINPQIAARLAQPFTRWQRYDKTRQTQMLHTLHHLSKKIQSIDLKEVIEKSLDCVS